MPINQTAMTQLLSTIRARKKASAQKLKDEQTTPKQDFENAEFAAKERRINAPPLNIISKDPNAQFKPAVRLLPTQQEKDDRRLILSGDLEPAGEPSPTTDFGRALKSQKAGTATPAEEIFLGVKPRAAREKAPPTNVEQVNEQVAGFILSGRYDEARKIIDAKSSTGGKADAKQSVKYGGHTSAITALEKGMFEFEPGSAGETAAREEIAFHQGQQQIIEFKGISDLTKARPPSQYPNKQFRDSVTGIMYVSDGVRWTPVEELNEPKVTTPRG